MAEQAINDLESVQDQWNQICSQLKNEVGDVAFDSWLKPLTPGTFNDGTMNICVPTRFMRNWVITHYSDRIHKIWEKKNPDIKNINFIVQAVQEEGHRANRRVRHCGRHLRAPDAHRLLRRVRSREVPRAHRLLPVARRWQGSDGAFTINRRISRYHR